MSDEQRPWHRLFALSWIDFFRGLPVSVEPEKDLSLKKQLLDLLLHVREPGPLPRRLPDGFDLGVYNLITFKSFREKLSPWALLELIGHGVNLRKQVSPGTDEDDLLPLEQFRLFAVCARFPRNLVEAGEELRAVQPGVYDLTVLGWRLRIVVINELPLEEHNAVLLLFSNQAERLAYGARHYHLYSAETSTLLLQLVQQYRAEGSTMPDLLEEFHRQTIDQLLRDLPLAKRLEGVPPEKLLESVPLAKRLEGVSPEKLLEGVPLAKRLEGVAADDLLSALPPAVREALLQRLKADPSG